MQTLKNGQLTVVVSSHGAELQSIRKNDTEYLWQGDPAFWGRRSPVLFPIVGSVWDGRYRAEGKEFHMGQHGFARDMDFTLVESSETEVRYRLEASEETFAKYPYPFVLEIAYRLHDNRLDVIWEVYNPGDSEIYFQIGAHPAFIYPDYGHEDAERGFLAFDRAEGLECIRIKGKGCVDTEVKYPFEVPADGMFPVAKDTFDTIDTIMMQGSQVGRVTLHRTDRTPWLSLSFDAPVVGIWSPPSKNAPFICIEPWYGRCDRYGYEGEFKDRDWVNVLQPGAVFRTEYTIEIF